MPTSSPVLPLRNSRIRLLRSCEQHCATSKRSWRGSPTTRCSPHNCCWASELADCSSTTQNSGRSTQRPHYLVGLLSVAPRAEQNTVSRILMGATYAGSCKRTSENSPSTHFGE